MDPVLDPAMNQIIGHPMAGTMGRMTFADLLAALSGGPEALAAALAGFRQGMPGGDRVRFPSDVPVPGGPVPNPMPEHAQGHAYGRYGMPPQAQGHAYGRLGIPRDQRGGQATAPMAPIAPTANARRPTYPQPAPAGAGGMPMGTPGRGRVRY